MILRKGESRTVWHSHKGLTPRLSCDKTPSNGRCWCTTSLSV